MTDVVISAAAVLNALAGGLAGFADGLRAGRTAVTGVDGRLPASARTAAGAWLEDFSVRGWMDRQGWQPEAGGGLIRATRRSAMPAQTAACVAVRAVLDAGLTPGDLDGTALIVAGGNLAMGYQAQALEAFAAGSLRPSHALTCLDSDVIGVVSEATGIRGEASVIGAASASAAVALIAAARLLSAGAADHCVVVAPLAELSAAEFRALHDSGAMAGPHAATAPHQLCRPFDQDRRGFVYGQGAAAVVLENGRRALARGVRPLGRILGHGQRLDGRRGTEPDPHGQVAAMRAALAAADVTPADVDYVNAHATGSVAGDAAEARSLHELFQGGRTPWSTRPRR
ncbi:beta-ketoacyl synthase N-terminal-like domain-containing protein [Catellatospora coxensis]